MPGGGSSSGKWGKVECDAMICQCVNFQAEFERTKKMRCKNESENGYFYISKE